MTAMATAAYGQLQRWAEGLASGLATTAAALTLHDYVRLVAIAGGYCLLRPYLLQLAGRFQAKDHERELDPAKMGHSSAAAVSPNSLRGLVEVPDDSEEEDEQDDEDENESRGAGSAMGAAADWGRAARRRQRRMLRTLLAADEKRQAAEAETDSDKDIEEFLVKR